MYILRTLLILTILVLTPAIAGCSGSAPEDVVSETGTVVFVDLEGGFFGIMGDTGVKYEVTNLSPEFQKDGLRVIFTAKRRGDLVGIHQWGVIVELVKIKKAPSRAAEPANNGSAYPLDRKLIAANTEFGLKLFTEIFRQGAGKNIFISPQSVNTALAMTFNGASGQTRTSMAKTLGLEGLTLQQVNQGNAALLKALANSDPKVRLDIANSLWARKGLPFQPEFIDRNRDFFGAKVANLEFSDPAAPALINAWAAQNTQQKIKEIVRDIDADTIMFLINAVYFKGQWAKEFDRKNTADGYFHFPDGSRKKHPLMSQSGDYRYLEGEKFQAVSLPYGAGRVSMYIFLPGADSSLAEFCSVLNAANWEKWLRKFSEKKGNVVLPRLKLEYETKLNDALIALGMGVAFDRDRAEFRELIDLGPERAFIKEVRHKTFVEVNEEGTEAAAATSVEFGVTCVQEEFNMLVDRPFFFAIRDNQTGALLFAGAVADPEV
jgi:serpin B